MDTDFSLIRKMKQGDEDAFDIFIRKYYGEILKYCCYHCREKESAEDLTQEVFLHFFAKFSDYHHIGKAKNYLYTIAGNLCKDFYKKKKEIPIDIIGLETCVESKDSEVLNRITIEWSIKQLPEELYEIIVLYYFQGLKLAEIASILHIGLPLVKYRLRQAKKQLEKLLRKEELYESGTTT